MTPNQLLQRTPETTDHYIAVLHDTWHNYDHVPELRGELPDTDPTKSIEIRYYKDFHFDLRRNWTLASVWFKDKPVMIIQNAGREGDDHAKRFIVDSTAYQDMIIHLNSLCRPYMYESQDAVVDPEVDIPNLTNFYGNELDGVFYIH
jgi:hypothetical protein